MTTDKADTLALILRAYGMAEWFDREYKFHPTRKFRADFAAPRYRLLIEVDGGQWKAGGGRHNTDADRAKLNEAAAMGWRVLRFSPAMLQDPDGVVRVIRAAMEVT